MAYVNRMVTQLKTSHDHEGPTLWPQNT